MVCGGNSVVACGQYLILEKEFICFSSKRGLVLSTIFIFRKLPSKLFKKKKKKKEKKEAKLN